MRTMKTRIRMTRRRKMRIGGCEEEEEEEEEEEARACVCVCVVPFPSNSKCFPP